MNADYEKARQADLTSIDRWDEGRDHHPESERLVKFLAEHDSKDYDGYFDWNIGGDGDNGETLMFQMDTYFEMKEIENPIASANPAIRIPIITDEIVDKVENLVGTGCGAWDMVDHKELIKSAAEIVLGIVTEDTLRIEPIESDLTWYLLNSTITGGKIIECMAAASNDGIGVIACWKMCEDGTYSIRALDTEGGWDDNPCDESNGEHSGIPNSPPFKYTR